MANILGTQTVNRVYVISTDINPQLGIGTPAPVGSICIPEDGSGIFLKQSISDTDWGLKATSVTTAVVTKIAAYTLTDSDNTVECNGSFPVTFPPLSGRLGREYNVTNIGNGLIKAYGDTSSEKINDEIYQIVPPKSNMKVKAGSTQWIIQ